MSGAIPELDFLFDGPPGPCEIVLTHGAGAPMDSALLSAIAAGLAAKGHRVARFEFPFMAARQQTPDRKPPPDRMPVLIAHWQTAIAALGLPAGLIIGGHSMGGRVASMIADEIGAKGLVCLAYPFHPPRKPDALRTAHLLNLRTPSLIIQGERDPFGTPDEVAGYGLSPAISLHWLGDGDHQLKPRVRSGFTVEAHHASAVAAIDSFANTSCNTAPT